MLVVRRCIIAITRGRTGRRVWGHYLPRGGPWLRGAQRPLLFVLPFCGCGCGGLWEEGDEVLLVSLVTLFQKQEAK